MEIKHKHFSEIKRSLGRTLICAIPIIIDLGRTDSRHKWYRPSNRTLNQLETNILPSIPCSCSINTIWKRRNISYAWTKSNWAHLLALSSLIVFAPKKDGKVRLFVYYRKLNKKKIKNECQLPHMDEYIDRLKEAYVLFPLIVNMVIGR